MLKQRDTPLAQNVIHHNKEIYMTYTIDRFEGEFAVVELENQAMINIPICALPLGVKEGDIISVKIDAAETQKRREHIKKLMNDVWAD